MYLEIFRLSSVHAPNWSGPPEMPSNCSLRNQTTRWLSVTCEANFDGGLPQRFFLELFDAESGKLRKNVTSPKAEFHVESPIDGGSLTLVIYAANDEGRSKSVFLEVRTAMLLDRRQGRPTARHTFFMSHPAISGLNRALHVRRKQCVSPSFDAIPWHRVWCDWVVHRLSSRCPSHLRFKTT